jgi:UDP-N-acetylglucosamine---dolichyl-phosphate N-acetylglucosaminyltransferase
MKTKQNKKEKQIFVIIPGYNEEEHIFDVVSRVKNQGFKNIIFIDDGSKDKSSIMAKKAGATVLRHIVNMGKGAAAKTGCDYALKNNADILVLIDSDGQHKPEDIKKFIQKIEKNDIVFGYRKLNANMPFVLRFGNWGINTSSKIINGIKLKDTQSGFRCITSETYKKIRWTSNNYSMESEMIANVAKYKLRYSEIPIETIYLDGFKGTTIIDGVKIFINMLKFRIRG